MALRAGTVILIFLSVYLAQSDRINCPGTKDLQFCSCILVSGKQAAHVVCESVPSVQDLRLIADALTDFSVDHFFLSNSAVEYVPKDIFLKNTIKRIEFSNTPLADISDENSALVGLERSLTELVLRYCKLGSTIQITKLKDLSVLSSLDLSFNALENIHHEMFNNPPPSLSQLYLKNCSISYISENAFSEISKLVLLDLSENFIASIYRSMLPVPANLLQFLYFSYNQIKEIPKNFFTNMTNLKTVYLDNNDLEELSETTWRNVWNNTPQALDILGNNINCNVNLCWLTFLESSFLRGSCSNPDELRGRRFITLWPWEVHCNESLYYGEMALPKKPSY